MLLYFFMIIGACMCSCAVGGFYMRMRNQLLKRQLLLPRLQAVLNHLTKILMRKVKMKSLQLKRLPRQLKRIAVAMNLILTNLRVKMRKKPQRKRTLMLKWWILRRNCIG
ncbi:uncharacterized protein LOC125579969 [Brassica napus]|uniref:(rape) hypothetical protein n=1 Tax=Brassica napus TaxID=3708 RepID=A0A816RPW3_BRANA|nr:uncharacterized protein LOC125579968 [Brassica napus]XP_048599849.1 uncharacterized protein LOC125579969 [Brassica napus]CAF2076526.1 unnamed protein product [Brassica napus]